MDDCDLPNNCEQNDQGDSGDSGQFSESPNENNYKVHQPRVIDFLKLHAISLQNDLTNRYVRNERNSNSNSRDNSSFSNSGERNNGRDNGHCDQNDSDQNGTNGYLLNGLTSNDLSNRFIPITPRISRSRVMSSNRDFRFTVEQIWLLQRLRGSGLSRDQIVAGLEDLDRLDGAGSNPQTHFSSFSNNLVNHITTNRPQSNGSENSKSPNEATEAEKIPSNSINSATLPQTFQSSPGAAQTAQIVSREKQNLTKAAAALLKPMQPFSAMWAANRVTNPVNPYAALGNQFTNNINEDKDQHSFRREEPDDLADEIEHINRAVEHCERRNQHEVKEEIRLFTQRHHISQTAISKATHQAISQSYISQWLTSNITMGDAKRRIIYEWFCRQKRRLEGVYPGTERHKGSTNGSTSGTSQNGNTLSSIQQRLMHLQNGASALGGAVPALANGDGRTVSSSPNGVNHTSPNIMSRKPRQRIMWPIKCLQFLDVAFGKNPYPGAAERGQLVIECNRLLGDENRTVEINECHVANWFRNRRKMKKVIDQSGPKSMEHFEELIAMEEGSNDGNDCFDDRQNEVTEIVDVEENSSRLDNGMVKTEPAHERIISSPGILRIDETKSPESNRSRSNPSPDISQSTNQNQSPSEPTNQISSFHSSIIQNSNSVLRSAIMPTSSVPNHYPSDSESMMRAVIQSSGPPPLTSAPSHSLFSQANRSKIIQSMNMNGRMEA